MAKDPAILFYTNDFLSGTFTMTDEQVGKYIRLLCLQHQKGELTEKDMLYICKTYDEDVYSKFTNENGIFYNKRMKDESEKRKKYSESRKNNVSKRFSKGNANTYVEHMENENENISFNERTKDKKNNKENVFEYFLGKGYGEEEAEEFYNHYEAQGWVTGSGVPISNWKVKAENWHKKQSSREINNQEVRELK